MNEPANSFDLLEMLRKRNGRETQSFRDVAKYIGLKAREKGVPVQGQFELTPICNFDCRMCYVHLDAAQAYTRRILTPDTWKDIMHQAWEAGMLQATLTGGECLAYPGFDELFLYLHSLGCEVTVLSNGYLLDEDRIRFFRNHTPNRIHITLYGSNDDVYERVTGKRAYGTVIRNIRNAVSAGLPVALSVTPNTYMGEDVFETVRIATEACRNVTVNSGIFAPREETGRSGQQDDPDLGLYLRIYQLLDKLNGLETITIDEDKLPPAGGPCHECREKGFTCGGGRSGFVIDWKGRMSPCNRMDMICCDVLQEGFKTAWARINREAENWPRVAECDGCAYFKVCKNCPAEMMTYAPPGSQPKGLCEKTRFFVRHGVVRLPDCE